MSRKYQVLDLFCGCGGFSKGFENAGFSVVLGIDNDDAALKTFENNHANSIGINADLSDLRVFDKIDALLKDDVDIIIAGPPCQGFSLTGSRNFEDGRNSLYLAVIEAIKRYLPSAFVIENVPGMATLYKGHVKDEIIKRLEEIGYSVRCTVLKAVDYGVPQKRERLVFVGVKSGEPFDFPLPYISSEQYVSCEDAISDLPSRERELGLEVDVYESIPKTEYQQKMRGNCNVLTNHVATNHTQLVKDVIALVPEGGNYKDLPEGVGTSRRFNEAWTRYHSKRPSKTIDTGHRNHFHYKYNRVPTIRENARLQSFPDDFVFFGTRTQQNRQVGNAVPPLLGEAIGKKLFLYLESKL